MNHLLYISILSFLLPTGALSSSPVGNFLLITDLHIDEKYDRKGNRSEMCHRSQDRKNETPKKEGAAAAKGAEEELGAFGDHNCDSPLALMNFMLDEAKRKIPKPNFIIWTGDTAAHVDYTINEFMETMKIASEAIAHRFPEVLVIPVMGNHDLQPSNSFSDDPKQLELYQNISELWNGWIGEESKETFLRGGYYRFKSPADDSEYLVLNTNIYYVLNRAMPKFSSPEDPTGQFEFIENNLKDVHSRNAKINIVAHVPPGSSFVYGCDPNENDCWQEEMPAKYNKRLLALFTEYASCIRWMLFGHLHTDTFRVLKDSDGTPVQRMFLNPAITPMFDLNNPAFRVFEYDTESFDIMDIKTYFVDLDQLNNAAADNQIETTLEYSMRDAYGLRTFDSVEMNALLERLTQNNTLFEEYMRYTRVMNIRAIGGSEGSMNSSRNVQLCVIGNLDSDSLKRCISETTPSSAARKPSASGFLLLAVIMFFSFLVAFLFKC